MADEKLDKFVNVFVKRARFHNDKLSIVNKNEAKKRLDSICIEVMCESLRAKARDKALHSLLEIVKESESFEESLIKVISKSLSSEQCDGTLATEMLCEAFGKTREEAVAVFKQWAEENQDRAKYFLSRYEKQEETRRILSDYFSGNEQSKLEA